MRALCLLALIGATFSGCCSTHRAWTDGYGSCVPQCDGSCPTTHKSCLFKKSSRSRCSSCSPCGSPCGSSCGDCESGCGSVSGGDFAGCSSCAGGQSFDGMSTSECASCAQGQTAYEGSTYSSMPQSSTCPTCHQNQMMSTPTIMPTQSVAPPPPTPPSTPANPMQNAPEPTQARLMQPMQMHQMQPIQMPQPQAAPLRLLSAPTQPVQYQEWQPHQSPPASSVPYNPPAQTPPQQTQTAVQPVLWVPAQSQATAPLLIPAQ